MATKYTDVTLSPPPGGGALTFTGTDANERVLFSDPHPAGFGSVDARLDLGGGGDLIPASPVASFHTATADGGSGDDRITLSADGDVTVHGGAGGDVLDLGSDYNATGYGDAGDDRISVEGDNVGKAYGGAGDDVIDARGGSNEIEGGLAYGGAGDDRIMVGGGNGNAFGDAGDDTLIGTGDYGVGHGGTGDDTLDFSGFDLELHGDAGDDKVTGEVLSADEQFLYGEAGNDTLRYALGGESAADATVDLFGGAGKDQLYAGDAHDVVHVLPANSPAGSGRDVVHGYRHGQDHIALDGGTRYTFVGETKDPGAGEVGFHHQGGDTIVDGFDGKAHFEVQLQGFHGHLDAGDFIA